MILRPTAGFLPDVGHRLIAVFVLGRMPRIAWISCLRAEKQGQLLRGNAVGQMGIVKRNENPGQRELIIFGVRSPMVVDFEEACNRAGIAIRAGVSLNGAPRSAGIGRICTLEGLDAEDLRFPFLACAFSPARRRTLAQLALARGLQPAEAVIDPSAVVARSSRIGEGSFVNTMAVVGAMSMIGEGVLINRSASLGHHCIIDDFVSIGPGVTMVGNTRVGSETVIGAGAVILPNVEIGAGAIVAAGSVVRKPVLAGALVSGNPARPQRILRAPRSTLADEGEE